MLAMLAQLALPFLIFATLQIAGRPAHAAPPIDLRSTSIEVREGIAGSLAPAHCYRDVLVDWDRDRGGFRAVERRDRWYWGLFHGIACPESVRARDLSEAEMRALADRLLELGVLELPSGDPQGSCDAYRRDTTLRFKHGGRSWQNKAVGGCVRMDPPAWPSLDDERRFELALEAIDDVVRWDELEPEEPSAPCVLPPADDPEDAVVAREFLGPRPSCDSWERVLRRQGDLYRDEEGSIPARELEELRAALLASRDSAFRVERLQSDPSPLFHALGISEQAYLAHQESVLDVVLRGTKPLPHGFAELPPSAREVLRFDAVAAELKTRLLPYRTACTSARLAFTLPGEPPLTVETAGDAPFLIPLRIRAGEDDWATADPSLLRGLAALLPPGVQRSSMERLTEVTPELVWSTGSLWGWATKPVKRAIERWGPEQVPRSAFGPELNIVRWDLAADDDGPRLVSLLAEVSPPRAGVRWLQVPWPRRTDVVLSLLHQANEAVAARPWIDAWCNAGPLRCVEARLLEPGERSADWDAAGLTGKPLFELRLLITYSSERTQVIGLAWVGRRADETLVSHLYWCPQSHADGDVCPTRPQPMPGVRLLPEDQRPKPPRGRFRH